MAAFRCGTARRTPRPCAAPSGSTSSARPTRRRSRSRPRSAWKCRRARKCRRSKAPPACTARGADALFLTANFLHGVEGGEYSSTAITFVLGNSTTRHGALRDAARLRGVRRALPEDAQDPARQPGRRDAAPVRAGGGSPGRHPGADRLRHGPRQPGGLPHGAHESEGHGEGRRPEGHPHQPSGKWAR